ncbi:3-deoxy-manno-octulosonate cytidylyltransferase [Helicobacter sp. WB40]|uniref:3-deoxy-manno-octulosonate cytidylyltransferase n=1 Tax=Helicobacter sp. WB40 TaxID=3004130 RepID=UPI0022EBC3EB|nr:3-deoxy-manno-octulosonate cytidylyltransferase [Helicobacter sp. WB40]MDA3967450.1 3-deoxy-manno-octulosonate cytidylyltransferase [Helicobacter sp. WB40]
MIIIPARLKSTRFPQKILQNIGGIPMIVRVANIAKEIDSVVVACEDNEVIEVCKTHNIEAILTSNHHNSGTDRIAECARILSLRDDELIINLQGDEPFLEQEVILSLKQTMLDNKDSFMGSCMKEISQQEAENPNLVKVVINKNNEALYFSRAKIPYNRDNESIMYYGHLGIYAFSGKSLQEFCNLPKSNMENIEKLEQLRALDNSKKIIMTKVDSKSFGIDTKEDLELAIKIFM